MRVEVACAHMMRVRRETVLVKFGQALWKLVEEVILEAVSRVLMSMTLAVQLVVKLRRALQSWLVRILPFESGFMKGTLTSWALGFSHITRPLNGLGFMEGILQCWAQYLF